MHDPAMKCAHTITDLL